MDWLLSLILKNGLNPLFIDHEIDEIAKKITRSELLALFVLRQREQSTMSQLASDMGLPSSTITNIRQRLTKRGLIEHHRDANDKRVILLRLTQDGEMLANQVMSKMNQVIKKVERALTSEELDQFLLLLVKVAKAIQTPDKQEEKKDARHLFRQINIEEG